MSSSIYDVSSVYNTYAQGISGAKATSVQDALGQVGDESTDEELMDACKGFEAYFVQKIIEQAKKTVALSEEEEGEYMQYFGDILNQTYADSIVESGGIGLATQLYESMKKTNI